MDFCATSCVKSPNKAEAFCIKFEDSSRLRAIKLPHP